MGAKEQTAAPATSSPAGAAAYFVALVEATAPPPAATPAEVAVRLREAALSAEARKKLPDSDFAIPEKREYPIQDKAHAEKAVQLSGGKPERARVLAAVYRRYPELKPSKGS